MPDGSGAPAGSCRGSSRRAAALPEVDDAAAGALADVDPWGCLFAENGLTTTSIGRIEPEAESYGILFVLAEADTPVDPVIERTAFETLCGQGMRMEFLPLEGHCLQSQSGL